MATDVNDLPDEIRKRVEDTFVELEELTRAVADATERRDGLRASLKRTLETIGLERGQGLQSQRLGLYALVVQSEHRRLDRDKLLSLGVSEAIIDRATVTYTTRPHIRFGQVGNPKHRTKTSHQNENGVNNGVKTPS